MTMGLEPMWTDLSDMLATCTDDQLLKWKEVAENPRGDNFKFIAPLRQLVVHMYNKRAKDIINELSIAVNDEIAFRNGDINMDKKLEARVARLEKLCNEASNTVKKSSRVSPVGDNESPAIVIDKGTLKRMNDKYRDSLSADNADEFKYELENEPDMPVVVIQFDGDKDYCIFQEDEVEIYQNYFLANIKETLSEVLEQMQGCDHEAKSYDDPRNQDRKKELIQCVRNVIASIKVLDKLCDELNK